MLILITACQFAKSRNFISYDRDHDDDDGGGFMRNKSKIVSIGVCFLLWFIFRFFFNVFQPSVADQQSISFFDDHIICF